MANSPARATVDVGSVIADTYTIEALIGRGGMGAVFVASHKRLPGKKVAIKVLHTNVDDAEVLARFKREAEITARLGHPNIVAITDVNVTADGMPYLVLEYLQGESLAQRIKQGPMAVEQVLSIMRQVGSALAAAHSNNIVHRDLKPQNIFLVPTEIDGRIAEIAKVLDFGISKDFASQTIQTQDNSLLGTPQYMAPEQATGQHTLVDERTDIFALGAIVYEMLCGRSAFSGASIPEVVFKVVYEQPKPLAEVAPGTPAAIVSAVERAMAKPANERFATVNAFIETLTGVPLASFRGPTPPTPEIGFAAGSRHSPPPRASAPNIASNDAFAHTVGSGDHGPAPAVSKSVVDAGANTVDSQRLQFGTDATIAPAAQSAHRAIPQTPIGARSVASRPPIDDRAVIEAPAPAPAPTRKPIVLMIGLAVVCVAAAATAIVFATRTTPHQVAHAIPDAAALVMPAITVDANFVAIVADAAQPTTPPVDAPVADAKPPADAGTSVARVDAGRTVVAVTNEDPIYKENLVKAEQALRNREYGLAEGFANTVINGETHNPSQKAQAKSIRGIVQCLHYQSDEKARNDLRGLDAFPAWRRRLLKACKAGGKLEADN